MDFKNKIPGQWCAGDLCLDGLEGFELVDQAADDVEAALPKGSGVHVDAGYERHDTGHGH
ncbi:MAG: hypothetical protein NT167_29005 [Verrucomicrobia bacterium]|nr:hypothetical protein [Verrucomicrobiota bacterium]